LAFGTNEQNSADFVLPQRPLARLAQDEKPGGSGCEAQRGGGMVPLTSLLLKRASASRPSGEWNEDDYDVLEDGAVVGRIFKVHAAPVDSPWMWTLTFWHHEDRTPTHGYEATREAAMAVAKLYESEESVRRAIAVAKASATACRRRNDAPGRRKSRRAH
jgi:hypothetical protein